MRQKGIRAKILSQDGQEANLDIAGQQIKLPNQYLPKQAIPGMIFEIFFINIEEGISDQTLAKSILEEILNGK